MNNGHERQGLVARLGKVPLIWLLLVASGPLGACVRQPSSSVDVEPTGSIGLALTAAPGVTLNAVNYIVSGTAFTKTGTIDTSGSPTVNGTIGGIPAARPLLSSTALPPTSSPRLWATSRSRQRSRATRSPRRSQGRASGGC